jgi:hypothetical protein
MKRTILKHFGVKHAVVNTKFLEYFVLKEVHGRTILKYILKKRGVKFSIGNQSGHQLPISRTGS